MTHKELCAAAAASLRSVPASFRPEVVVGFDGFVDSIIDVVEVRQDTTTYRSFATIAAFGKKVNEAAGKSANFELVVKQVKIGGNGPIMANALCSYEFAVTAVGVLGGDHVHPAFQPLAQRAAKVVNLGPNCATDALEFHDGKLMLVKPAPLDAVTWSRLTQVCGGIEGVKGLVRTAKAVATVNWTMTLGMTEIWRRFAAEVLPGLRGDRPLWFIDLADPAKRTREDILAGLEAMKQLNRHVDVVLGLNEAECRQIIEVLGERWTAVSPEWEAAREACVLIRAKLGLSRIMCHLVKSSAVAWEGGSAGAEGFFEPKPKITTGAGDHFNAGFVSGLLAGIAPAQCLQIGGATSGYYVRTGVSPARAQVCEFLQRYAS
jgi:hypothetical protein